MCVQYFDFTNVYTYKYDRVLCVYSTLTLQNVYTYKYDRVLCVYSTLTLQMYIRTNMTGYYVCTVL